MVQDTPFPLALLISSATPAALMSFSKAIGVFTLFVLWAWTATRLDIDLVRHALPRAAWNSIHITSAAVGLILLFVFPIFWLALPFTLTFMATSFIAYVFYRNSLVPPSKRWNWSVDTYREKAQQMQFARAQHHATVKFLDGRDEVLPVPGPRDVLAPVHQQIQELFDFALPRRAERIDIVVAGNQQAALVVVVDGVKYPRENPGARIALSMIDYLKERAALDVGDRRRRQSALLRIDAGDLGTHALRLTTSGTNRELQLSLRIDPDKQMLIPLPELGLLPTQLHQLESLFHEGEGVVLLACPAHQGLTTTLYSLLKKHDPYTQMIATLEEESTLEVEGLSHHTFDPDADAQTTLEKVENVLHMHPQVLMLSRLTDSVVADCLARASRSTRIYAGIKAPDTFSSLAEWTRLVGDVSLAANSLRAIIAQRMMRKLCPACREAYPADAELLRRHNLPPERVSVFFRQSGHMPGLDKTEICADCMGMGYLDRIVVFEVMMIDDQARDYIESGQTDALRKYLRKQRMLYLEDAALLRVVEGVTSVSEINRVLSRE